MRAARAALKAALLGAPHSAGHTHRLPLNQPGGRATESLGVAAKGCAGGACGV